MLELRNGGFQLLGHAGVVEALELPGEDKCTALREAQDVVELAHAEIRVHLVGDGADQLEREKDDREGDAVGQLDGDDVASPDADATQERGALFDPGLQLAIGDALLGVGEHLPIRVLAGTRLQDLEERLVGPQPTLDVAARQLGLHDGLETHGTTSQRTALSNPPSTCTAVPVM